MSAVVGIDPSLGGFAIAVGSRGRVRHLAEHNSRPRGTGVHARMERIRELVVEAEDVINIQPEPVVVLIEGYSMGSKGSAVTGLAELGGVLRWCLLERDPKQVIVEVPPATLKKWATGKGNAGKPAVVSALSRRYQRDFRSDNEADAFALATLGMAAIGAADVTTKWQREVAVRVAEQIREVSRAA